ncbi:hypothetical protein AOQ84DRAFT_263031, partial [Glonium stellatum]
YHVALVRMSGMGKIHGAMMAAHLHFGFEEIRITLVVGVCGWVSFLRNEEEVVLGDIIISTGVMR